jgi:hypothetical protein
MVPLAFFFFVEYILVSFLQISTQTDLGPKAKDIAEKVVAQKVRNHHITTQNLMRQSNQNIEFNSTWRTRSIGSAIGTLHLHVP